MGDEVLPTPLEEGHVTLPPCDPNCVHPYLCCHTFVVPIVCIHPCATHINDLSYLCS